MENRNLNGEKIDSADLEIFLVDPGVPLPQIAPRAIHTTAKKVGESRLARSAVTEDINRCLVAEQLLA